MIEILLILNTLLALIAVYQRIVQLEATERGNRNAGMGVERE